VAALARNKSSNVRKLTDSQIGVAFGLANLGLSGQDARKKTECLIVAGQAESSLNINPPKNSKSTARGPLQQTKYFSQRNPSNRQKELTVTEREDIKIAGSHFCGVLDTVPGWQDMSIGEAVYRVQRCEPQNKYIYNDEARVDVACTIAELFYPEQESMMNNAFYNPRPR